MKPTTYLLLILALALSPRAAAKLNNLPVDPEVRIGTLPCGLTYYIRHNTNPAGCADFFLAQSIGSINESDSQQGLAHFLEHMCFNGTRHFPGNSLIDYLESVGVKFGRNLNAYTSTDETVYNICDVPLSTPGRMDSCLLILRDWSRDLTLDPREIDAERGVIEGEWRQRMGAASTRLLEQVLPQVYGTSAYGQRMPIGKMDVVRNFRPADLRDFYDRWCNPMNQCVIVTGDIDPDSVENRIRALWADITLPPGARKATPPGIDIDCAPIHASASDPEQAGSMLQIYLRYPAVDSTEVNTVAELTADMYAGLITSMLVDRFELIERTPGIPFYNLGIGNSHFLLTRSQPALMLRAGVAPGREKEAVEILASELKRAAIHGITATELQRALLTYRNDIDRQYLNTPHTTNTDYARRYSRHFLDGGALPSADVYYKTMKGLISQADTAKVNCQLREIVRPDNSGVVLITYLDNDTPTPDGILQAYTAIDDTMLQPYVDMPVDENLLDSLPMPGSIVAQTTDTVFGSTILTLSNGIKVCLRPTPGNGDKVYIMGYSPGGLSQHYSPSHIAEYRLMEDALAISGFGKYSSTDLRRRLASTDIRSSVTIGNMDEKIEVTSSTSHLATAFQLLHLKATSIVPDTLAYRAMIENHRLKLTSRSANPTFIMGDSIHYYVYNRHPLGGKLSAADLDNADYTNIIHTYRDRFSDMSDFTFYITGSFSPDSIAPLIAKYIASLPAANRREQPRGIGYGYAPGMDRNFTCSMELPQSICYSFYHSPCPYTLTNVLTATVAGNIIQNRLRKTLREERGWTYSVKSHCGISAGYNGDDSPQLIMPVYIKLHPDNVAPTQQIISEVISTLCDSTTIDPAEIAAQISQLEKNHEQALDAPTYWLIVMRAFDRFGADMHTGYTDLLRSLTPADISHFIATYLIPAQRLRLTMNPAE